jgi:hypothetical protein
MLRHRQYLLIYVLAFVSGFCIMGVELLGGRILAPYFGSSIHIWGSIITVFMLSLSFGYLLGGKWSIHFASTTRFAWLFVVGGLALLPIYFMAEPVMERLFVLIEDSRYGSLAAAIALFFIPTLILGMISPYAVRLLAVEQHTTGQVAGSLYFISTLGSALGTIITSFYLVLYLEINTIVLAFSGCLVFCGVFALLLSYIFAQRSQQAHHLDHDSVDLPNAHFK